MMTAKLLLALLVCGGNAQAYERMASLQDLLDTAGRAAAPVVPAVSPKPQDALDPRDVKAFGTPPSEINTIVCDGRGGIRLHLVTVDACLNACVVVHETTHVQDALARNPVVCLNQTEGITVRFLGPTLRETERRAAAAEVACMRERLPSVPPACAARLRTRIEFMDRYEGIYPGVRAGLIYCAPS